MVYGIKKQWLAAGIAAFILTLQACSWGSGGRPAFSGGYSNDGPGRMPKKSEQKDAKPRWEARTRAGNAEKYTVLGKTYYTLKTAEGYHRRGVASWYGRKFHGNNTANGERYDMYEMTAAHKSLPIPSYVRVRNLSNGREAVVRINDRGPFVDHREIDLSFAAAVKLGVFDTGTAPVEVTGIEVKPNGDIIKTRKSATYAPFAQPAATQTTEPLAQPAALSAQALPAATAEQWWVQAGAFQQTNSARSLSRKLQAEGFPNIVVDTGQETLNHKVRVGPFVLPTHAHWAQTSLAEKGLNKGFVVKTTPR